MRYTTRGDVSNHEIRLLTFSQALSALELLQLQNSEDLRKVLLVDISDDMGDVLNLLDRVRTDAAAPLPCLIAMCPPGDVDDVLTNRLFELGFSGLLQKPIQHSHLIEVIRSTLTRPLNSLGISNTPNSPEHDPE